MIGVNAANNDAIRPQWRPPSDGGSTRLLEVPGGAGVVAAMEPAAERREHGVLVGQQPVSAHVAAMEPAAAWWEHSVPAFAPRMLLSPPQWSPPGTAGAPASTRRPGSSIACRNGARR